MHAKPEGSGPAAHGADSPAHGGRSDASPPAGDASTREPKTGAEIQRSLTSTRFNPVQILALSPAPMVCVDAEGRLLWLNHAAERLTGYSTAEVLGHSFLVLAAPDERRRLSCHFVRQHRREIPETRRKSVLVTRDGRTLWAMLDVVRIRASGTDLHYVASIQDLQDIHFEVEALRRRVKDLSTTTEEAKQAARLKGEFLATISHEIRTPMNGIMGMTRLLLESNLDRDQRSFVQVIASSSEALLALINDTLDFSKIEAGKLDLENIDFNLRVTMDAVQGALGPRAEEKQLQFACSVHHTVPACLRGDPGRLRQVMLNLAGNAIKFTERGEVVIHVDVAEDGVNTVTLRFAVRDTGIGMTEDQMKTLFQNFSQADASITRRFGGTGLGLAICRRLVTLMGGEVGVESVPGEGSTFWFKVPFDKRAPEVSGAPLPQVELRGLRVLIADPAPSMRLALGEMLTAWGCESVDTEDGESALAIVRENQRRGTPFRVVIVDMQLSGLDAEALAKEIRAVGDGEPPLLMLLTNLGRRGDAARAQEWGYAAYLLKPVQQSHFYDALVEMVHEGGKGKVEVAATPLITRHSVAEKRHQRTRVLLVEDNAVNQLVATAALRRMGFQPEVASNGRVAIEACSKEAFDVIFMDIQMPDMDGYQATAEIRKREGEERHTPIIAVTAHASDGDRAKCLAAGMDDYISKPIDFDAMCATVEKWTKKEELHEGTRKAADAVPPPPVEPMIERTDLGPVPPRGLEVKEAPPIDEGRLESSSMGSPELRTVLMRAFMTHGRPRLVRLRNLLAQGDAHGVHFEAHGMKGMCSTVGALRCADLFAKIERFGKEGRLEPVGPLLDRADIEIGLVESMIGPRMKAAA